VSAKAIYRLYVKLLNVNEALSARVIRADAKLTAHSRDIYSKIE
jgi:hypothetical protein